MLHESIAITGVGILACNGLGREAYWDALRHGRSGIRRIRRFDASDFPCQIAGELWDFNPEDFMRKGEVKNWQRHVHQAVASSRMAVDDAALPSAGYDPERIAVAFGTSVGGPNEIYEESKQALESQGWRKISKFASSSYAGHSATVHVTVNLGMRGPAITISSGCATGLDVIGWGIQQLRGGSVDAVLVGATESPVFPLALAGACSLGILSKRNADPEGAMRPFDRNSDGLVLSDGAVALVMERADHARARGARILGELAGHGSSAEGLSPLILDKEGKGLARAMTAALGNAGIASDNVDYAHPHGVSLSMYDRSETNAYKLALGPRAYRIPLSATKSLTGQSYAAGGLLGVASALFTLNTGIVPATKNLTDPDPACDLDFVPLHARMNDINTALVTSISFGGTHSAVVLRRMN